MFKIRANSDNFIEFNGPVEKTSTGEAVEIAGTCSAYIFNDANDVFLSEDKAASATTLNVESDNDPDATSGWTVNLTGAAGSSLSAASVVDGDGARDLITVSSLTANTIVLDVNTIPAVRAGTLVSNLVVPPITMSVYNSASATVGTYDWGYRGTLLVGYTRQFSVGTRLRIEIRFVTDSDLTVVETMYATVVAGASST